MWTLKNVFLYLFKTRKTESKANILAYSWTITKAEVYEVDILLHLLISAMSDVKVVNLLDPKYYSDFTKI